MTEKSKNWSKRRKYNWKNNKFKYTRVVTGCMFAKNLKANLGVSKTLHA